MKGGKSLTTKREGVRIGLPSVSWKKVLKDFLEQGRSGCSKVTLCLVGQLGRGGNNHGRTEKIEGRGSIKMGER